MREKKARSSPVIIAPTMLVAAKLIARRTTARSIAPRMPASKTGSMVHAHPRVPLPRVKRSIAR